MPAEPQLKLTAADCVNKLVHNLSNLSAGARPSKITTGSVVFHRWTSTSLQASVAVEPETVDFTVTPSVCSTSWLWLPGSVVVGVQRHSFEVVTYRCTIDRTYTDADEFVQDLQYEVRNLHQRRLVAEAKIAENWDRNRKQMSEYLSALKPAAPGDKFVLVLDSLGGGHVR